MTHNHIENTSIKNIKIAFFLNLFFTIIEFIGGFLTNSIAIMSDALHDLGDSFSLGLAWGLEKVSSKKRTLKFSYGYRRLSLLAALINAVILFIGSVFILINAISRLIYPQVSNAKGMFILAIFGIIVNGFGVYKTTKGKTMNEKVISLHLLEDVLGWVAVFIISIVMIFSKITILDPILSLFITFYIIRGVLKNLKATILLFLQATPKNLNIMDIKKQLKSYNLVLDVHSAHAWSLDGQRHIFSAHIVVSKNSIKKDIQRLKLELKNLLETFGIECSTLEVEFEDESCQNCCILQGDSL